MNNNNHLVEQWLTGIDPRDEHAGREIWEPGFEADRRVVVSRLGPYFRLFPRPKRFVKRFYHTVYKLPIEDWRLHDQIKLYGDFCTIDVTLDLRFQATFQYALSNREELPEINAQIKAGYEGLIRDILNKEVRALVNGEWIQQGLAPVEKRIDRAVNEMLLLKNIQCRALTTLRAGFANLTRSAEIDGRFAHEKIYLNVLQRNQEFLEKQQQEKFRRRELEESQKLEHKQKLLQQRHQEDELARLQQRQEAENKLLRLQEQEKQLREQQLLEERIHQEKTQHEIRLREMTIAAELQEQEKSLVLKQQTEQQMQIEKLSHQGQLKEKELEEEIKAFERKQKRWNQIKESLYDEKLALDKQLKQKELEFELEFQQSNQAQQQKMQEELQADKLVHESRIKDMELDAEVAEQKRRFEATEKSAAYLRREIELLLLEKQRVEINQAIKKAEQQENDEADG